jgi:hypothetical protein
MMRYEWTPASEPPNDSRSVLVWIGSVGEWAEGFYAHGRWYKHIFPETSVTLWRDVEPPNSSATLTGSPDVPEIGFGNMAGGD